MKVAIVGQGYVGLPVAIAAASAGHQVIGIDTNSSLVESLQNGKSPIGDISDSQISAVSKSYSATTDLSEISKAEVIVICVPTPLDTKGEPDLGPLTSALNATSQNLTDGSLVIIESTISPGTTRGLAKDILDKSGREYLLAYSPERIDPANKEWNVANTPKLVAGLDQTATQKATEFYKTFVKDVVVASSLEVIETAKLLENTFRLINISFINEFADFCHKMGIDVREVVDAAATKPYGFMPFYPGAGVGGHCIPVDPSYLVSKAKELGASTEFINLANKVNHSMGDYFAKLAEKEIGSLKGKNILLVGVAYKPDVADTRETPAQGIYESLIKTGTTVAFHDSLVVEWNGKKSEPLSKEFDLAILINPHANTDLTALGNIKVIDTRGGY